MIDFQVFKGNDGDWHWRAVNSGNHKIMADGGEGYANRQDCIDSMQAVLAAGVAAASPETGLVEFAIYDTDPRR